MKKILLLIILAMLLTGCKKGVSQEEYDTLKLDFDNQKRENQILRTRYDSLEEENETNKTNYEEYLEKYNEILNTNNETVIIEALGKKIFDEDVYFIPLNEDTAQIFVPVNKVTEKSLETFFDTCYNNLDSICNLSNIFSENITKTYINLVDNDFQPIMSLFLNKDLPGNEALNILFNIKYSSITNKALKKALENISTQEN